MKIGIVLFFLFASEHLIAQENLSPLTVEKIMRDPKWIGTSPSSPYWSSDGKYLLFKWNPEKAVSDSVYYVSGSNLQPVKTTANLRNNVVPAQSVTYNKTRTAIAFARNGDIFMTDLKTGHEKRITETVDYESEPAFSFNGTSVVYSRNQNLYAWDIATGLTKQVTNFQKGQAPADLRPANRRRMQALPKEKKEAANAQEKWLQQDQLQYFQVLKSRKQKRDNADSMNKVEQQPAEIHNIYTDDKIVSNIVISPDGRFISYLLSKPGLDAKNTVIPNYVTESGFTQDINGRTKVGAAQDTYEFFILDREKDTIIAVSPSQIPGITDLPDYVKDYPSKDTMKSKALPRSVIFNGPDWQENGAKAVVDIRSADNKDRWLMLLDAASGKLSLLDRQRDEAWIGGPGIGYHFGSANAGWLDDNYYWYQSEITGYSHLYKINTGTGEKTALTKGKFEVQDAKLSANKKYFYLSTNEVQPGEQQFYRLSVSGGKPERITTLTGANQVTISPDEKQIAFLYSYSNKPWELYEQENKSGSVPHRVTTKSTGAEFNSYPWRDPELITFTASDGATVYARLYRPAKPNATKAAVIFVHGAGYLQNAHKWWSSYFREYMFNNLLADKGYTVLDIDYRGSAGYGRDWRTGIYRHMGGKDLSDQVDGVKYLVEKEGVDPKHVGLYGGSYGGFITLMALFTQPDVFAAGAGLRSVTDWAHYNHEYTSDILNEPFTDSLAYRRSSPIYFAEGLKGHLLMCHGMVDVNVHFQDIVRLSQRLIELGKNNWELAVYPMEDHGFVEPSSWTDEYKRILKLFDSCLAN